MSTCCSSSKVNVSLGPDQPREVDGEEEKEEIQEVK